ncbi:hypothetical protein PCIT_a2414 [Pseudoalteromonas citrea]|uniref:Uncharacterized protein n=1 Tax=Pseudoalteromonas citrea TaxID=43655 RepID=A0AAD4AJV1_9GAMM|nr:hypothetical protein PCIT_a2414 [Pseudoalteromonas citrea]
MASRHSSPLALPKSLSLTLGFNELIEDFKAHFAAKLAT